MSDNRIADYYNKTYRSQAIDGLTNGVTEKFKDRLQAMGNDYLDDHTLRDYRHNVNIVRQDIIQHIINRYMIQIKAFYLSVNANSLEAHAVKNDEDRVFYIDELLEGFILEYLFMCFSIAYDSSKENIAFISRLFSALCKDYVLNHSFPMYEEQRVQDTVTYIAGIPEAGNHHAANYYWCIETFLMGHEIYHLLETADIKDPEKREIMADNFGCLCLVDLIDDAQKGLVTDRYNVFDPKYYMAPYMFFEIYLFINRYLIKHGRKPIDDELFRIRRDNFAEEVFKRLPEQYDTDEGNDLLNILLDAGEIIQERVLEENYE